MDRKTIEGELARICGWDNAFFGYAIDTETNKVTYILRTYQRGVGSCTHEYDDYAAAKEAFDNFYKMVA